MTIRHDLWVFVLATATVLSPASHSFGADAALATPPGDRARAGDERNGQADREEGEHDTAVASGVADRSADDTPPGDVSQGDDPQQTDAAEVFVPTEDISEDFAVPFPVDI